MYLHERDNWTAFHWDSEAILRPLSLARFSQGVLLGEIEEIGLEYETEAEAEVLVSEVIASSQIEGIALNMDKVRSSVARRLGIERAGVIADTRDVDGAVGILLDATQNAREPLTHERLFGWHESLFSRGYGGFHHIDIGQYRVREMQIVSGAIGHECVHYEAPAPELVARMMDDFLVWFNDDVEMEPLIKAGLAHIWFVAIHPFDDGNGRITRALTEMLLARSDNASRRYYSMAGRILTDREKYYTVLERSQKSDSDMTAWLFWFLITLNDAINQSRMSIREILQRAEFWRKHGGVSLNERQTKILKKLQSDFEGKLTSTKWAKICRVSHDTALRDINDLVEKGILAQDRSGGRSTAYRLAR